MTKREYKSTLFSMLLREPEYALQVFNVLNNSNITDSSEVQIYNLEAGASLLRRNDAAFIVGMHLNIYEHQSTVNPNMPLRSVLYFASIMEKYVRNRNLLSSKMVKIPTPHFAVFYNGKPEEAEQKILKLSDSFQLETKEPELELICHMYNINRGNNVGLLDKCKVLRDYMILVNKVRSYSGDGIELDMAIKRAVDECIDESVLKKFLIEHRTEVEEMIRIDGTWEEYEEMIKQEAYEDGQEQGHKAGMAEGSELIMSLLELPESQREELRKKLNERKVKN
ncbi:MAG: hypothetical protein ACI4EV_08640 [Lachnospiraceae bacterium]